tara:strand:+ start:1203 stop:1676 length:474 start_codon:yes stop_codon:yes gene_type:complete
MRKIFILSTCLFFYGFIDGDDQPGPAKPIEIGIASLNIEENYTLSIYMISEKPVSGIQLDLGPQSSFTIDSVYGGITEQNGFSLHYNESGRILAFSMEGKTIPASKSLNKEDNILFNVSFSPSSDFSLNEHITIKPIFADDKAKKMDYVSIPFQIGK